MRRIMTSMLLAVLAALMVVSTALAGPRLWYPEMNSPVSPADIQADHGTPAQDVTPDQPWLGGYPYDVVPNHPLPGDNGLPQ